MAPQTASLAAPGSGAGGEVKDWLTEIFEGFTPEWFFRVAGTLTAVFIVFIVFTGSWPGNEKDGYADNLWANIVWLYVAWGAVELLRLWVDDDREPRDRSSRWVARARGTLGLTPSGGVSGVAGVGRAARLALPSTCPLWLCPWQLAGIMGE